MAQTYSSFRPATSHTGNSGKPVYTPATFAESHGITLQKGQLVHGQISNITAKELTLLLENGQSLTARYDNTLEMLIGDLATFRVVSSDEHGIVLRNLPEHNKPQALVDATILKALESASLPVTERNINLVSALLKHNLPINAPMLGHILQESLHNPDISLPNLVAMHHIGLPVNPETTHWFENYSNLEHQLLPQFQDIISDTITYLDDLLSRSTPAAAKYAHTLLAIPKSRELNLTFYNNDAADLLKHPASSLPSEISTASPDSAVSSDSAISSQSAFSQTASPQDVFLQDFMKILQEWQLPEKFAGSSSPSDSRNLVRTLQTILSTDKMLPHTENGIRHILKHPFFRQFTHDLLLNGWVLTPDELFQKDSIKQLYERIHSQLTQLEEVISKSTTAKETPASIQQAKQNITFLGTLNELYTYIQLPLKLTGGHTHGDLYVYTEKHKRNTPSKEQFSCLLHLNMSRLGTLDIRVQMSDGRIKTLFYTDDNDSATLIESHLPELDKALAKRSIPMTSQVIHHSLRQEMSKDNTQKESSVFLQNLLDADDLSSPIQRYSFDIRA